MKIRRRPNKGRDYQAEAEAKNAAWRALSQKEQWDELVRRNGSDFGGSVKQRRRICGSPEILAAVEALLKI